MDVGSVVAGLDWLAWGLAGGAACALVSRERILRSERKAANAAAAEARRLGSFRPAPETAGALLAALPDPVALVTADGRITVQNDAFAALSVAALGAPVAALAVLRRGEAVRGVDGSVLVDEEIATPAGRRWFAWAEREMAGGAGLLRSGREVTGRVETERALEEARGKAEAASAAKSRFLATVSHEFRTPLAGILGMSDLLLDTALEPEQLSYVQALRTSAEALGTLIEEILDFSRIEAGKIDLADDAFELEPLVQGVVELLAPRAQDKGIEVSCFVAGDVPRRIRGDRDRLRQILFNLAGNAMKFTARGGVGVTVERGEGDALLFGVTDTGPGIADDRLETIFEEFDQGGLRTTREAGTGLGLAITRRLVERMAGAVSVDSVLNRGSIFRVRLPLPADGEAAPASHPVRAGLRALLVGEGAFEANFLARRLGERGVRSVRVPTLADALAALGREPVDILIVDGAFGTEAVSRLNAAARERGVGRSIVLLSPFERRQFGSHRAVGFDSYLTKPVRTQSLFERLGEAGEAGPAAAIRPAPREMPAVGRLRVLLAEDNEVNALIAVKSLGKLGAIVDWAKDGPSALAKAEAALAGEAPPFDLILMDMRMPGMDGFEVTRRIREREAETGREERCRIVALTASLHGFEARVKETAGFDGFLQKPFTPAALAALLEGADARPLAAAS